MISVLDSGSSGLSSSPGWDCCIVFLGVDHLTFEVGEDVLVQARFS